MPKVSNGHNGFTATGVNPDSPPLAEPLPSVPDPLQSLLDLAVDPDPKFSRGIDALARELLVQLDPQDAAEKMLVTQMIATFGRSMFLSRFANRQKHPKWFGLVSAECGRAMNLYRKQMQSLAEYRRPRRTVFTAIRNANIAGQQVVVTGGATPIDPQREDGYAETVQTAGQAKATLPPVGRGKGRPASRHRQNQAVGT